MNYRKHYNSPKSLSLGELKRREVGKREGWETEGKREGEEEGEIKGKRES